LILVKYQITPSTLKGKRSTALINLKTSAIVRPTILKGRRISQIRGRTKIKTSAKGQHKTRSMNQKIMTSKVFITWPLCNGKAKNENCNWRVI
jgi:hypothetical protein